jgi:hypothetical protein
MLVGSEDELAAVLAHEVSMNGQGIYDHMGFWLSG